MKKFFATIIFFSLLFVGCSTQKQKDWREFFHISFTRIEESEYDNAYEKLDALLNGTSVHASHEFSITNKTNDSFDGAYLVLVIYSEESSFNLKKYIGNIDPNEIVKVSLLDEEVLIEMERKNIQYDEWGVTVANVEYSK